MFRWIALVVGTAVSLCPLACVAAEPGPPAEMPRLQFNRALPNVPGKSLTSLVVEFPPGAVALPHRHGDAFVYAYVLEGTVRSQLDDEAPKTYRAGEDWFEAPGAHHVLTQNLSTTSGARLLVVFIATTGDALKVADPL